MLILGVSSYKPNMKCQKDLDARWTKKHGKSHYGYKNHISIDKQDKLIRRYKVTDAVRRQLTCPVRRQLS